VLPLLNPSQLQPPVSKPSSAGWHQPASNLPLHSYKRLQLLPHPRTPWLPYSVVQQAQDFPPRTRAPSSPSYSEAPSYNLTPTSRPPTKTSNRSSDPKTAPDSELAETIDFPFGKTTTRYLSDSATN